MHALSDAEIVEIRDECLPSQGEPFDCIKFARAIEAAVLKKSADKCGIELGAQCPLCSEG